MSSGKSKFLVLDPSKKTFHWSSSKEKGKLTAKNHFRNVEGIDFRVGNLYFVSKILEKLFILDLDNNTYEVKSTRSGKLGGSPDQLQRILGSSADPSNDKLYFTEEGGAQSGIHEKIQATRNRTSCKVTDFEHLVELYPDPFLHFTHGRDSLREYTTKLYTTYIVMYDEARGTMIQNDARKNKLDEEEFQGKRFKARKKKENASPNFERPP